LVDPAFSSIPRADKIGIFGKGYYRRRFINIGGGKMYLSIRRYKTDEERVGEVMRLVEDRFLPRVREIPGFIKYYGVDCGDGLVAFINFFEEEAGAERSNEIASEWVKENLSNYFPLPADITAGRVMVRGEK